MVRWILALAATVMLAVPGLAADKQGNFAFGYDVASATMTYCTVTGKNGDPFDTTGFKFQAPTFDIEIDGAGGVTDAGTNGSFAAVEVGDTFLLRPGDGDTSVTPVVPNVETWVVAKASDDAITVANTTATANYRAYFYKKLACGITAEDGWISTTDFDKGTVQLSVYYEAGDVTGLDVVWECRESALGAAAVQVYPGPASDCGFGTLNTNVCTFATPGDALARQIIVPLFAECRMGLAFRTADGGTRDDVHATISGTGANP